jgi:hypothetical protein
MWLSILQFSLPSRRSGHEVTLVAVLRRLDVAVHCRCETPGQVCAFLEQAPRARAHHIYAHHAVLVHLDVGAPLVPRALRCRHPRLERGLDARDALQCSRQGVADAVVGGRSPSSTGAGSRVRAGAPRLGERRAGLLVGFVVALHCPLRPRAVVVPRPIAVVGGAVALLPLCHVLVLSTRVRTRVVPYYYHQHQRTIAIILQYWLLMVAFGLVTSIGCFVWAWPPSTTACW